MTEWANAVPLQNTPGLIYKRFAWVKTCANRYHTQTNAEECAKYWEEQAFLSFTKPGTNCGGCFLCLYLAGWAVGWRLCCGLWDCKKFDLRVSFWCHTILFNKWPSPVLFADFFHKPFSSYTIYRHFLFSPDVLHFPSLNRMCICTTYKLSIE